MPLLQIKDLHIHFPGIKGPSRPVQGLDLEIHAGETVCLVGESGCGKTLSALSILGLLPCPPGSIPKGQVLLQGRDVLQMSLKELQCLRGDQVGMVFQDPLTSLNPVFSIGQQLAEAFLAHNRMQPQELRKACIQALRKAGIQDAEARLDNYPHQLSGGQRQRVLIAMAMACEPDLLIADEPTTALDVTVQAQILSLLKSLTQKQGQSVLYITHDLGVVHSVADRVYIMYAGLIVEQGLKQNIFQDPRHPYTQGLLASLPGFEKKGQKLYTIPGSVPDPAHRPSGCPFHPRCYAAQKKCSKNLPRLESCGPEHFSRCPVVLHQPHTAATESPKLQGSCATK
ncbi:MAG: ABC transporter ATP-binding protein [Desulfohalobiaceae bacterium]